MNKTAYLTVMLVFFSAAGMANAAGDPKAGEAKAELCFDCHGINGISEDNTFPKLAGQYEDYIIKQIKRFKNGERNDDTMTDMAMMIETDQDLEDIAAYFSSQPDMTGTPAQPPITVERKIRKRGESEKIVDVPIADLGKDLFLDASFTKCYECHGIDGRGKRYRSRGAPKLAGQHKAYLLKAMDDIRTNKRQADRFGLMKRGLISISEDERGYIAEWLSGLGAEVEVTEQ